MRRLAIPRWIWPIVFLFGVIIVLFTFMVEAFASGPGELPLPLIFLYLTLRILEFALFFAPVWIIPILIWIGLRVHTERKAKTHKNQTP